MWDIHLQPAGQILFYESNISYSVPQGIQGSLKVDRQQEDI